MNKGVRDPELRFSRATRWGQPSDHRPDLGPCLMFIGADNGNGYGQFRYNGSNGYAHRYAWERANGPIPDGLTVDHLCRVRLCVNVRHLELVEGVENYLRAVRIRTHCPNGHEYTGRTENGKRRCMECKLAVWRKQSAKQTAEVQARGDKRFRYDQELKSQLITAAVERRITVAEAANQLGCALKYMDKCVRREARARGISSRRSA